VDGCYISGRFGIGVGSNTPANPHAKMVWLTRIDYYLANPQHLPSQALVVGWQCSELLCGACTLKKLGFGYAQAAS
jgi:hypothetical protein